MRNSCSREENAACTREVRRKSECAINGKNLLARPAHMVDLAAAMLVVRGCVFQNVRTQQSKMEMFCKIAGSVSTEHETTSPTPVGLVRHSGGALDERQNWSLADHFVLESSGRWLFRVGPGTYGLVAFE